MITVKDLEAAGCALNAGYMDYYSHETGHVRLALITTAGDIVWEDGGEEFAERLVVDSVLSIMDAKAE